MVVVDVVATDKKEEPATDLNQSDFSLTEDGKEQTIKVFSFQQPQKEHAPVNLAETEKKLPPNVYTNVPSYKPDSALNVILLDGLNTTMPNQAYVRDQMIRYLEHMPDDRPVAVYTLGTKLRMLQDFTIDHHILKEAVRKLKTSASPLLDNPSGGPEQELLPAGLADSGILSVNMLDAIMSFEQERTAAQTDMRIAYTLNAMNVISRQLAGYPGRKNLVWISEAFPITIDPNMELQNAFIGTPNYGPEIATTAEAMVDAQVAIYPIDARGLVGSSYFSAANTGRDKFGRSLGAAPGRLGTALSTESSSLQSAHASMQDLAERTGGRAFYNRNDLDGAIRRSIDDGSTYYTLAYYPSNKKWDGKFRKIHVKVNRPGIKLRYRLGYFAVDPRTVKDNEKLQAANFSDAMSIEDPVATALAFHVGVVPPSAATKYKVYVNFGVDPHAISFEEDNRGLQHAQVECAIAAFSEKGKYVKSNGGATNAALKPETFQKVMQGMFPCTEVIELPPGNYLLRLGVRDLASGLMGTTNAKVTVPAAEAQAGAGK